MLQVSTGSIIAISPKAKGIGWGGLPEGLLGVLCGLEGALFVSRLWTSSVLFDHSFRRNVLLISCGGLLSQSQQKMLALPHAVYG